MLQVSLEIVRFAELLNARLCSHCRMSPNMYRNTAILRAATYQLQLQSCAARRIAFRYRARFVRFLEGIPRRIVFSPEINFDFHYRLKLWLVVQGSNFRDKLKGNNYRAKSFRHFFTLFPTSPHCFTLFQIFSPGLFSKLGHF